MSELKPKHGEWWMCDRGGVNVVFLNDEGEWRGDDKDSYSYCNVKPLYKMEKVSEKVEQVEWSNGDECLVKGTNAQWVGNDPMDSTQSIVAKYKEGLGYVDLVFVANEFLSKPETLEAKKEREELEAVNELIEIIKPCIWVRNGFGFITDTDNKTLTKCALKVIEKTGYRKGE